MIFRNVIWFKGKFGAVAVLMTPLDTIGSQARDAKMILGVRIIMMMRRIWVMAITIMVIAVKDDPPPRHDWVPREGGEASGNQFDGNFWECRQLKFGFTFEQREVHQAVPKSQLLSENQMSTLNMMSISYFYFILIFAQDKTKGLIIMRYPYFTQFISN